MVTCSDRLLFFIVLIVKVYYISALVTFCGVEWSLVSFLFEKKKKKTLGLIEPVLNCQPVFSGQLTVQHTFL